MSEKQEAFSDIIEKMRRDGIVHDGRPCRAREELRRGYGAGIETS